MGKIIDRVRRRQERAIEVQAFYAQLDTEREMLRAWAFANGLNSWEFTKREDGTFDEKFYPGETDGGLH